MRKTVQGAGENGGQTDSTGKRRRQPPPTAAQFAVSALQKLIEDRKLGPGAPLPPQRDLAREFNISRATLREALKENVQAFRAAAHAQDFAAFAQIDFEFHKLIMRFSRNRLLADMHDTFGRVLLDSSRLPVRRDKLWAPVMEHERVVEALTMGDPEGAGYYMRRHLSRTADRAGITMTEFV